MDVDKDQSNRQRESFIHKNVFAEIEQALSNLYLKIIRTMANAEMLIKSQAAFKSQAVLYII